MADAFPLGFPTSQAVHVNLAAPRWIELAIARGEAVFDNRGALVALTAPYTGRAAKDKYVVTAPGSEPHVWWNDVNQRMSVEAFQRIQERVETRLGTRELFVFEGAACADSGQRLNVRVVAEKAWHALFAQQLLRRDAPSSPPALTVLHAADLKLDPARDGTRSPAAIILHLDQGLILIAGTHYAGEIKKSIFSYLNYLLPQRGVFPMHCSATCGPAGDTALLFGLSGTGKTTLSADPQRRLIGDDEHGWSHDGVFNFEGGCYAKCIHLTEASEPQIYRALRFGSILENVVLEPVTRRPNFDDASITENTRAAYPLDYIPDAELSGQGGHPRHIFFLTCDAYGVLPPLSRLTPEQTMYHFLSGYTAKIAGTEAGVKEPQATFSTCFAAPFLTLPPMRYADLLRDRLDRHGSQVWLVNTGWSGGAYGQGKRFPLPITRRLVQAALLGEMKYTAFAPDPVFGLLVPHHCPGVPPEMLQPRQAWSNPEEYDRQAARLAELFRNNFAKHFSAAPEAVREAGPKFY